MLIAVLNANEYNLMNKEVYLKYIGLRYEPAADLAVIASLISANANISISKDTIFLVKLVYLVR